MNLYFWCDSLGAILDASWMHPVHLVLMEAKIETPAPQSIRISLTFFFQAQGALIVSSSNYKGPAESLDCDFLCLAVVSFLETSLTMQ